MVNGPLVEEFGLNQIRGADVRVMCYFDSIDKKNNKEVKLDLDSVPSACSVRWESTFLNRKKRKCNNNSNLAYEGI